MREQKNVIVRGGKPYLWQTNEQFIPAVSEISIQFRHHTEFVKTKVVENDMTLLFRQSAPECQESVPVALPPLLTLPVGFRRSFQCFVQVRVVSGKLNSVLDQSL